MKKSYLQISLFFLGPILAAFFGMYTASVMGIPINVFYPNIGAILVGIPLVFLLAPRWTDKRPLLVLQLSVLSIVLLLLCFLFPGVNDVHRWVSIGGLDANVSMMVLPLALFCLHQLLHEQKILYAIALYAAIGAILGIEPDAGQASAFALAGLVLYFRNKVELKFRLAALLIAVVTIALAWNRIDLLEPVAYVEDIFYLMASLGPMGLIGMTAISLLLFFPFVYLSMKRIETVRTLSVTFIVYLATSFVVTELGNYPVPVMGSGASSVIGWFLMLSFVFRIY